MSTTVGLIGILKDEGPYLLEWLAHYRLLGVSRFYLADNGGSDDTSELLERLDRAGLVTRIEWPSLEKRGFQVAAYSEMFERFGAEVDWMAFIDGDEFVLLSPQVDTLPELIGQIADGAGVINLNWAIYGSSGHAENDGRLVMERFTNRAEQKFHVNNHTKFIVRTAALERLTNPHFVHLKPGYRAVDSNGDLLVMPNVGRTAEVIWGAARINHYVVKSRGEFEIKLTHGRVDGGNPPRDLSFFNGHDRNEIYDPMPAEIVADTKREIERLKAMISAV